MKVIIWFAWGLLAYVLTYGSHVTGNEIKLALYILFGFWSFLFWLFFTSWVGTILAILIIVGVALVLTSK